METADDYHTSNGDCSPRKENLRMLVDLSPGAANGQHSHSPTSPSVHAIKQEEGAEDEAERRPPGPDETPHSGEEGSVLEENMIDSPNTLQEAGTGTEGPPDTGVRLPNGDRPFQCNQCGVSFTQKGNLLRHIKLHTGEKPFKCPFCSYACRRRDALTGHLRTHSGKPHKCNYCGRSYKQRTSLEEHKERCHNYLQSVGMEQAHNPGPYAGDVLKDQRSLGEHGSIVSFERPPVIERLQANVAKRKSTTPQKFVGEKMMRYAYPDLSFDVGLKYEKEAEMLHTTHMMDQAVSNAMSFLSSDALRPLVQHPPLTMADVVPMVNPLFHPVYPIGPRLERPDSREALAQLPQPPADFSSNGPLPLIRPKAAPMPVSVTSAGARDGSPNNSGHDSADSARSSPRGDKLGGVRPHPRASPGFVRGEEAGSRGGAASSRGDGVRVFAREGQELRAFQCEHCRILFLDHVMYTIHMGCHGYRDPLECNICGHCSKDRYEFSSHIVRGVHTFR